MLRSKLVLAVISLAVWTPQVMAQGEEEAASGELPSGQATIKVRHDVVPKAAEGQVDLKSLAQIERLRQRTGEDFAMPAPIHPGFDLDQLGPSVPATGINVESKAEKAGDDFAFFQNDSLGGGAPHFFVSSINEPSVGMSGEVVFYSGNWFTALSRDGGETFNFVDPFRGPFPPANDGFCCDQVVIHDTENNAIYYLQQFLADSTSGTQRISVDQGADGDFDCAWDVTPQLLGQPNGRWFDYPDLVLSEGFVYHTTNIFRTSDDSFTGSAVIRYSRAEMAACGSNLGFRYLVTAQAGPRLAHGARTTMYWATHLDNRTIRIYRWSDGADRIFWDDRTLRSWNNRGYSCPAADGTNACGRSDDRILAGYVANGVIGFLWNAAQGGSYPYPYIEYSRFNEGDRTLIDQDPIWNPDFAWFYPSVSVNERGHLGGTLFVSGGTIQHSCVAWIRDELTANQLDAFVAVASSDGPARNEMGDYLSTRPHPAYPNTFIGTCYSFQGGGADVDAVPQFMWFGRERDGAASGPPNDAFRNRIALTGDSGTASGSNEDATKERGEPDHAGDDGGASVWWSWKAPRSGKLTIDTVGSGFDTLLAAYRGRGVRGLTEIASNDDISTSSRASRITFSVRRNLDYQIAVDGWNGATGGVVLSWSLSGAQVCTPNVLTACLGNGRFQVEADWRDGNGQSGQGRLVPTCTTDGASVFYFANSNDWDLAVRVVDGCSDNDRFWVLAAAMTDVEFTLRVTDTESGDIQTYSNPLGHLPSSIIDRTAFDSCP